MTMTISYTPFLAAVEGSLSDGLALMVVGMIVVFGALIVLLAIIAAMNHVMPDTPPAPATPQPAPAARPMAAAPPPITKIDDGRIDNKLLAILTAAAATAVGQAVRVQGVQRLGTARQRAWSRSGRRHIMQSHRPHRPH